MKDSYSCVKQSTKNCLFFPAVSSPWDYQGVYRCARRGNCFEFLIKDTAYRLERADPVYVTEIKRPCYYLCLANPYKVLSFLQPLYGQRGVLRCCLLTLSGLRALYDVHLWEDGFISFIYCGLAAVSQDEGL